MISVVTPIYNEYEVFPRFYERITTVLNSLGQNWELVCVDDGSTDGTTAMLAQLADSDSNVVVVELSRNWGHQAALTAGIRAAEGNSIVLIDADLQDPPELIPELVAKWREGAQVVIAQRRTRKERGVRGLLMRGFYRVFAYLSDFPIVLNAGIFGLLDRSAARALADLDERNRFLPGLRSWVGFTTATVLYDRDARQAGEPKQSLVRLFRYSLDAIFSFSYKPLRLSLVLGSLCALSAFLFALVLIACRLLRVGLFGESVVVGYTSTIASVLFLGGVQLFCAGLMGEYIGRIYDEVKRRPLFLVRRTRSKSRSASTIG